MATIISTKTSSVGGLSVTGDASGILQLASADGTTALTIDASQNVGIGTSSPVDKLQIEGNIYLGTTGRTIYQGGSADLTLQVNTGVTKFLRANGVSESMRIDSSGNLLVGTTSTLFASSHDFVNSGPAVLGLRNSGATAGLYWQVGPDSNSSFKVYNASNVGVFLSNGSTAWASSSDERLKTDLIPIENGLEKVNSLRSVTGRFKTDEEGVSRSFLIAQDVQAVLPEAVSVQDDEIGTLGVAYTEVIPLLVASIKELKAIIDTQNARIEALEAK
jgi:hypothetical protein